MRPVNYFVTLLLLLSYILLLSACGGGGSSGSGNPLTASAEITFPPNGALVDGNTLVVSGTAADRDDVASVRVNGIAATSNDGFTNWSASIPIVRGANTLTVELTDGDNNLHDNLDSISIQNELFTPSLATMAVDADNNRLLTIDSFRRSMVSVDINSGERSIFSGEGIPDGDNPFVTPRAILLDADNNRALVLDAAALLAVDLSSGARTVLSDENNPNSNNPIGALAANMALDRANNRVLITNQNSFFNPFPGTQPQDAEVLAVDLTTGVRTVFSDETTPNGNTPFNSPGMIAVDSNQNRVLVADTVGSSVVENVLLSVSLIDGQRQLFSGMGVPNSVNPLSIPLGLAVDQQNNRAIVLQIDNSLLAINLNSGARTILLNSPPAGGTPFGIARFGSLPNAIVLSQDASRLFTSRTTGALIDAVDLASGNREVVSDLSRVPDADNVFGFPTAIAYDATNSRTLVADLINRIVSVDPQTGARTVVYEEVPQPGVFGFSFGAGSNIYLGDNSNRVYLFTRELDVIDPANPGIGFPVSSLVVVDLNNGSREVISDGDDNQSLTFEIPIALAVDEDDGFAYVLDQQGILRVNTNTGIRELWVEAPTVASGPIPFGDSFTGFIIDSDNNRLLATNFGRDLIAIDLNTQSQTLISAGGITSNPLSISINPLPLLLDSARDRVLLVNQREIEAIDLQTGNRTTFSGSNVGITDTPLLSPQSLALDTDNDRILAADTIMRAIYAIDPVTGSRAVHSR